MLSDDEILEAELRRLVPSPASARLWAGLAAELSSRDASQAFAPVTEFPRWRRWAGWSCAAAVLVSFGLAAIAPSQRLNSTTARNAQAQLQPVAADQVVLQTKDDGVVTLPDGGQARRYRIKSVDTVTWSDPKTGASLSWTVPREDVRLVPVSYY